MLSDADKVVLFMRPGCHVCARVKKHLTERDIPFSVRDVDSEPLTPRELWEIFNRKADRLRVPFTVLNDGEDVVLGYDPLRLDGVFVQGDHGGWQVSTPVREPRIYDAYIDPELDRRLWQCDVGAGVQLVTGDGWLRATSAAAAPASGGADPERLLLSTERFATPPGSCVTFDLEMAVEAAGGSTGLNAAFGSAAAVDIAGGISIGFQVGSEAIYAVHERRLLPGVTLPEEQFVHRVVLSAETAPGVHRLAVKYCHDTGSVRWDVDGKCGYWATTPHPIEGCSLALGLGAGRDRSGSVQAQQTAGLTVRWSPWTVSSA